MTFPVGRPWSGVLTAEKAPSSMSFLIKGLSDARRPALGPITGEQVKETMAIMETNRS